MNFKTTINLFDVGSKRCFVKFFFHFEEVGSFLPSRHLSSDIVSFANSQGTYTTC